MIQALDLVLYPLHDFIICICLVISSVYLLGGKYKKNIPALIIIPAIIIANAVFAIAFFDGTSEDKRLILDLISSAVYILAAAFFVKDIKLSRRIWFLLLVVFTMEMFYSLFAPYLPEQLYVRSVVYIIMYSVMIGFIMYTVKHSAVNFMPQVFDSIPKAIFIAVLFFDLTGYYKSFGEFYDWYNILYIASSIGVIICVLFFVLKIFTLSYQQNEILKQFNEQKNYSEKMLKGDENLRRFRHDYRNHMIVINAFLESGNTQRAREYINAMNADINNVLNKISTGNMVADALINNKAVLAAADGNKIKFTGQFPKYGIADDDVCTLLANALDNALEAVQKIEDESVIRVDATVKNRFFVLTVTNPVLEDVKIGKNNTIKTTKANRNEHGIGTKNIQKVVKKYNGALDLECENKIFSFSVRLTLQQTDEEEQKKEE